MPENNSEFKGDFVIEKEVVPSSNKMFQSEIFPLPIAPIDPSVVIVPVRVAVPKSSKRLYVIGAANAPTEVNVILSAVMDSKNEKRK